MTVKTKRIIGWVLSGLITAFMLFSASGKFMDFPNKEEMMAKLGWSTETMFKVGFVEAAVTILFLVPQSALFGAILLAAYLGGATAAHVRIGDPFFFPIIIGVLVWVALGLRDPRVFDMALKPPRNETAG